MKNIVATLFLIAAIATAANAQFAFETGLNMGDLAIKNNGVKTTTGFKPAASFGIVGDMSFSDHVYFEPGLFFDQGGSKITDAVGNTGKFYLNSVELPLNIEYKTGERCGPRFMIGAGPYIAHNVSASADADAYGTKPASSYDYTIGPAKGQIKSTDLGLGANVGYILKKHLYFRIHYQVGLANLNPIGTSDNSLKTSAFGITIGYLVGGCRARRGSSAFHVAPNNHWRGLSKGRYSRRLKYAY